MKETNKVCEKVKDFFENKKLDYRFLYNEAGLQHELALYLRAELDEAKILLELSVYNLPLPVYNKQSPCLLRSSKFSKTKDFKFIKKEIDIFIENEGEKVVIELKFPRPTTGFPAEIYGALKDVKFGEEVLENRKADQFITIFITDHIAVTNIEKRKNNTSIMYSLFSSESPSFNAESGLENNLLPFMKARPNTFPEIELNKEYPIEWKNYNDKLQYYIIHSKS